MSIKSVTPSNHPILCRPLLLPPSIFPRIKVFSNESVLRIRWPKYWSFSFSISPSNEYSGLIPFRMDWLDLLAVQGTLKSLLQHHSSKVSILQRSAFFYSPTLTSIHEYWKKLYLWLDGSLSLLFNMLSRLVTAFLPRKKLFFFFFMASVTICSYFGAPKYKACHYFHCFPIYLVWWRKVTMFK